MNFSSQKIRMINIDDIRPNPYQCRRNFNIRKLNNLTDSIKKTGILCPLTLRATSTGYEIVFGSRRFRSAIMAGLKEVPAIIIKAGDKQCAQLNLLENIQRENLSEFEEAEAFYNLISYHRVKKEALAEFLSLDPDEIKNKIKLLGADPYIRYKAEENLLDEDTVRELLKIHDPEKQRETADIIINEKLDFQDSASLIKRTNRELMKTKKKPRVTNVVLCKNTIKKTVNILKEHGEKVEFEQKEDDNYIEFSLKIRKTGVF